MSNRTTAPRMTQREAGRKIRTGWEVYAVTQLGMSAGEAIAAFNAWEDGVREEAARRALGEGV